MAPYRQDAMSTHPHVSMSAHAARTRVADPRTPDHGAAAGHSPVGRKEA
jgi:hypothetical protein